MEIHLSPYKQIGRVIVILILAILSLMGQKTLPDPSVPLGQFTATTNPAGIAFYQKQPHSSYLLSPYSDYVVIGDKSHSLIQENHPESAIERPGTTFPTNMVQQIQAYLGKATLRYASLLPTKTIYTGIIGSNTLSVVRTYYVQEHSQPTEIAATLQYSRDDVIVDDIGMLLSESDDETVKVYEQVTKKEVLRLTTINDRRRKSLSKSLFILNRRTPGIIQIKVSPSDYVIVDNEQKKIEFIDENPEIKEKTILTQYEIVILADMWGSTL